MGDYEVIRQGINESGTRNWNFSVQTVSASGPIIRQEGTFALMFTNTGDRTVTVNGMILYPGVPGTSLGDSRSLAGHLMDLFKGQINVAFAAGGNPLLEVVQLFYTEITVKK